MTNMYIRVNIYLTFHASYSFICIKYWDVTFILIIFVKVGDFVFETTNLNGLENSLDDRIKRH